MPSFSAWANDVFPGTIITGASGSLTSNNGAATGEFGEPIGIGGGALKTMWYSWTAPTSGTVVVGTCNNTLSTTTNFDTVVGVFTGAAVNALATVGQVDDTAGCASTVNPNYASAVGFTATAGVTYRFRVDGYGGGVGNYNFYYGRTSTNLTVTDTTATEGADTAAFTMSLSTVPTANVTVTIGTSPQCTFAPATLTFTLGNWNVAQTVTATAIDDAAIEGVHSCTPASITTAGGNYVGVTTTPPVLTVNDNDGLINIVTTDNAATETAGNTGAFTTVLSSAPSANVTVTVGTSPQCTFAPATLTFTTANWATAQTVTATPINDAAVEGPHTCSPASISGAGGGYTGVTATPPTINITDNDFTVVSIANTTNGAEAGPTNGVITVSQTLVSAINTVLAYSVSGTAVSGTDYTALSGTVTILAGATSATITIPVLNDAILEPADSVIITLTSVTSGQATLGAPLAATNTIADDDTATVSIANTTNGAEAGPTSGILTVTQTAVSSTNTVLSYTVSGTATSGTDFTALSGTVTILAGATTATITIPTLDDAVLDPSETVIVTLTAVSSGLPTLGTPLIATNILADNEAATVTIANTTQGAEAGPANGVMTVSQTLASPTNTVMSYTVSGTATSGTDFTALSGTVTILAGATSATITIPVLNDAIVEPGETVIVTLTAVTSGHPTLGATLIATNTIADNDTATVSIANTSGSSEAGPVGGIMTVTQTAVSATNTVVTYTVGGTATSGSDYTALSGTVTILAGATTATISIPIINDVAIELSETVDVTLTAISSGLPTLGATVAATNTIVDNDLATISIANTSGSLEAGAVNGVLTLTQSAISPTNTVLVYTVSGTATSGSDFTALSGSVTILAGATTATISIPVINDAIVEGSETVIVTLTSVSSGLATLGAPVVATNTITDNDAANVSIANTTNGAEAGVLAGVMTLTQTAVSSSDTVISYSVSGTATTGSDFSALSGTITIQAGLTTATISIPVLNDAIVESSETVIITLTSISSGLATLGSPVAATNTIADDDSATVTIANTTNGAEAGTVNGIMTLTQTAVSSINTVISYTVSGTAASGLDFTTLSGTVTILTGATSATISIPVLNDAIVEPGETVIVTLTAVTSGYPTLGATLIATNTIADNDSATVAIANNTNGTEAGPTNGVMTLTQTAASATDTVIVYSVTGSATSGSDYTALSGTVTILAGATNVTISLPIINDTIVEGSETVVVTLTSVSSGLATLGAPLVATNTIADNDSATVSIANTTNGAETGPASGTMTLTQSAVSATNTVVTYSVTGTATSASDFTALSGSVTILAGATTATISIPVLNDAVVEGSESVIVTLTSISSGLATLGAPLAATNTIGDNDSATVSIANTTNGAETGPVNGVLTLTQTAVSATDTVIAYSVSGTATSGSDYTALSGTVTIPAGSTTATIIVPITNDAIVESSETVSITLTSVSSGLATLSATVLATNTISDNDAATVSIANTTNGAEAGAVAGVMTLTQTAVSATNTILTYTVSGTASSGSDYTALSGTVTILAGSTTATFNIPVINDLVVDPNETVVVTLSAISGLPTLGSPLVATNTITDNDIASFTITKAVNLPTVTTTSTLNYSITVANSGNIPLTAPSLSDSLSNGAALTLTSGPILSSGDAAPLGVLGVGETWIYAATYTVTQSNIDNGATISNSAIFDTAETAPLGSNTVTTTISQNPHLKITKTKSTGGPVAVGAIITYTYEVENDGNLTMTNVAVNDTHNGYGTLVGPTDEVLTTDAAPSGDTTDGPTNGTWDTLAPGDIVTFEATYEVQQLDVDYLQ